jgi:hypothetical protein
MTNKTRLQKLEGTKSKVEVTWRDFIDWTNGKIFDADTEARLKKEWGEVTAKAEDKLTANTSQNPRA